jgi:manganese/zinc/iron transport system permease protein
MMIGLNYFCDPLLQASSLGCLLLGASCGLIGTLLLLRQACLIGETLSHASYPGLMLSALIISSFDLNFFDDSTISHVDLILLLGALISSSLGFYLYSLMTRSRISSDAALGWILASFLGIGVLMASRLQFITPRLYQRSQAFLYGQAATLTMVHVKLLTLEFILILGTFFFGYRSLLCTHFDLPFAKTQKMQHPLFQIWLYALTNALIVSGIRTGGVLVIAAILVAPAVASRAFSTSVKQMAIGAALIGAFSSFIGHVASVEVELFLHDKSVDTIFFPTGPSIAIVACLLALLFRLLTPRTGVVYMVWQRRKRTGELLKALNEQRKP